jgi:hypothetical protein
MRRVQKRRAEYSGETFPGADLTIEEIAFGREMDRFKREHGRPYPTAAEILAVEIAMGYRKVIVPHHGGIHESASIQRGM